MLTRNVSPAEGRSAELITICASEINDAENTFKIYPDPATEEIFISTGFIPNKNSFVEIINAEGELIVTQKITGGKISVDVSLLSKGVYFLKVGDERKCLWGKFLKM